jgi:hypothetical protein
VLSSSSPRKEGAAGTFKRCSPRSRGTAGEIAVRSPSLMRGHPGLPQATGGLP